VTGPSSDSDLDADGQIQALRLENDLLTGELLRLRLAGGARSTSSDLAEQAPVTSATGASLDAAPALMSPVAPPESPVGDAQQVLTDLRWLLARLSESPLGVVLRRRAGFRALIERYGTDSDPA
jgi:hypothetical protein